MTGNDKLADVFPCVVEVVFFHCFGEWKVMLRVRPRVRHPIGRPYFNKPDAVRFARRLVRDLNISVRVLE